MAYATSCNEFPVLFFRLITHSQALQELDLDDNLIGDLGGREILEALMDRKEGYWKKYALFLFLRLRLFCFVLFFLLLFVCFFSGYNDASRLL